MIIINRKYFLLSVVIIFIIGLSLYTFLLNKLNKKDLELKNTKEEVELFRKKVSNLEDSINVKLSSNSIYRDSLIKLDKYHINKEDSLESILKIKEKELKNIKGKFSGLEYDSLIKIAIKEYEISNSNN